MPKEPNNEFITQVKKSGSFALEQLSMDYTEETTVQPTEDEQLVDYLNNQISALKDELERTRKKNLALRLQNRELRQKEKKRKQKKKNAEKKEQQTKDEESPCDKFKAYCEMVYLDEDKNPLKLADTQENPIPETPNKRKEKAQLSPENKGLDVYESFSTFLLFKEQIKAQRSALLPPSIADSGDDSQQQVLPTKSTSLPVMGHGQPDFVRCSSTSLLTLYKNKNKVFSSHVRGKIHIDDLKPTQFNVGRRACQSQEKKFTKLAKSQDIDKIVLRIEKKTVPIVIGPGNQKYMLDRHHTTFALNASEVPHHLKVIPYLAISDLSHLTEVEFWNKMIRNGCTYLSRNGSGYLPPVLLPSHISLLTDDPFRTFAWAIKSRKGFKGSPVPFAEFMWADFLRQQEELQDLDLEGDKVFEALDIGIKICLSERASFLPGYIGQEKYDLARERRKKRKRKEDQKQKRIQTKAKPTPSPSSQLSH